MSNKGLSRREFLKAAGAVGASAALGDLSKFHVPAYVRQTGEFDLSDPGKVGEALLAEGAKVVIHSWGFSGLPETTLIPKFAEYTERLYGVPVTAEWATGSFGNMLTELPLADKHIRELGIDVIDKEEENFKKIMALEWGEPVNMEQYLPLLTELPDVEAPYIFNVPDLPVDGGDIYGVVYQGYEWLQGLIRKDKVDITHYTDWIDLARDEMTGKGIDYPFNDSRGHFVFMGILNSLIQKKYVEGDLWSQEAWEAGITWWRDNLENKILRFGDIGNDPTMRLSLQTGEAWWAATWGVYTRELLAIDWNKQEDVLEAFYPESGIAADRETMTPVAGADHPIAARILINWFVSNEFQHVGWYKQSPDDTEGTNTWNVTEDKYLVVYAGGVKPTNREVMPEWAKPYYPEDPGSLILPVDWEWYTPNAEWISSTYDRIVKGI
jgi:TAT (twin-arginine translocation) pathway signal sequence